MSRLFYHTMQDNAGNLLFDVSGTMRLAGTGTLATIYGDEALTVILPNPMTNHPSFGSFKCFLGAGDYDFYMAKAGYTFETLTGVQGLGTMAQQDASAVAITGGAAGLQTLGVGAVAPAVNGTTHLNGAVGIQHAPQSNIALWVGFSKLVQAGMLMQAIENDAGGNPAVSFNNVAGTGVGSITTTATVTAYNTTLDARLKKDVTDLTGELAVIQALRPVRFKWNADDSEGHGFFAAEVAAHVPGVITGTEGAVDEAGGIVPQQIDYSKLVPYFVGAIKTLTARLAVFLEDALGV